MFPSNTSHTGHEQKMFQRASRNRNVIKVVSISAAIALGTGLSLAAPLSASASDTQDASANGQFLSGTVAGVNLAKLAAISGASATNSGSQGTQVVKNPLGVSALGKTLINQPNGVQLNLGNVIQLGTLGQYAEAGTDGNSMASSGAIGSTGGIGITGGTPSASGTATLDLQPLLNSKFASVLTDLKLQVIAAAAQAKAQNHTASGSYSLAGLQLDFTSPAIAGLDSKVTAALAPASAQLAALSGPDGQLAKTVNGVVQGINPLLNVLGANASVSANVTSNLNAAVAPLLTGVYQANGVSFNLQTGAVSVDLAKLLGGNLNNEPAGTNVLSDKVVNQILQGITGTVASLADQVDSKAQSALQNAQVNVDAAVTASTPQAPVLGKTCVNAGAGGTGSGSGGLLGGLLGNLGGALTGGASGGVGGLICTATSTLLPNLKTSLNVNVHGTAAQLVAGDPTQAAATLTLLGVPTTVDVGHIVSGMGADLTSDLLGSAPVTALQNAIQSKVVAPAVTGLLGTDSSVGTALDDAVSVKLNNQDKTSTGMFTETALKVGVLDGATTSGLATVNLAQASVGPNVTNVTPTNPGDPGTPGNPGNPGDPGTPINGANPHSPITPTAFGSLAFTGVGIGALVAAILALLAAGAYLVREGYRRNSRRQTP